MFQENQEFDLNGLFDRINAAMLDEYATAGLRTGIRATIAALYGAGHLTGPALAYAAILGAGEVDPLIVVQLGTHTAGTEDFYNALVEASAAHEDVCDRAVDALAGAADEINALAEAHRGEGTGGNQGGGGDAGGADAGAVPAHD